MPAVKPSITGIGRYRTYRPVRAKARATRISPASAPTISTPVAPNCATTGTSTTVIAPVGPET